MRESIYNEMFPAGDKLKPLEIMYENGRISFKVYINAIQTGSTDSGNGRDMLILYTWIMAEFTPIKSANMRHSSYALKHVFEKMHNGFYITNDEFKTAMRDCGFVPVDEKELNWHFYISQRSTAVRRLGRGEWL